MALGQRLIARKSVKVSHPLWREIRNKSQLSKVKCDNGGRRARPVQRRNVNQIVPSSILESVVYLSRPVAFCGQCGARITSGSMK